MKPRIGQRVTTIETVEAYYAGSDTRVLFEPGDIGIVAAVNVPCVRGREGSTFNCVDFEKHGQTHRCALKNNQMREVSPCICRKNSPYVNKNCTAREHKQ